jgi:flavin reductase (DIM6/NTAB) family NADH-FMN oxidoreductase RutF
MKKPWNRVNSPVYSISSKADGEQNMHIITYATAVSMQPKQFVVALYNGIKTLELVNKNTHFVLQVLSSSQYNLIKLLGQQSGYRVNKIQLLTKRKLIKEWNGFMVLTDALAWIELKGIPLPVPTQYQQPDHQIFLCDLVTYKNVNTGEPLTLEILREKKIIRG